MARLPSFLARSLEPLISALWILFLVWTVITGALWLGGDQFAESITNTGLRSAVAVLIKSADTLWLVLAVANLYLHFAEREGLARARLVALTIAATAAAVAAGSAATGFPLGAVFYTARLGMRLGGVPLGWPLLWIVVILSGRELAARLFPKLRHEALALVTGGWALLTDLNLEPVATKVRFYWFWHLPGSHLPSPPLWRNYLTWFVVAAILAWFIRDHRLTSPAPPSWRPAIVLLLVNSVFALGHYHLVLAG
jgi:uncharacterized membrane protein